jgi:hemerythrin-like domain-containing protein
MLPIEQLCDEHRELAELSAELLRIVDGHAPDAAAVASIRWEMCRAITDHCALEDQAVYSPLITSGHGAACRMAWRFRSEFGNIGEEFRLYIGAWPVDRISRDWTGFGAVTRVLLGLLAERIKREEHELYPMAQSVLETRAA